MMRRHSKKYDRASRFYRANVGSSLGSSPIRHSPTKNTCELCGKTSPLTFVRGAKICINCKAIDDFMFSQ